MATLFFLTEGEKMAARKKSKQSKKGKKAKKRKPVARKKRKVAKKRKAAGKAKKKTRAKKKTAKRRAKKKVARKPKKKAVKKRAKKKVAKKTKKKTKAKKKTAKRKTTPRSKAPAKKAVVTAIPAVAPVSEDERIGVVTHYYSHLSVAVVHLDAGALRVGDTIRIKGFTSDFTQKVESMEVDHVHVSQAFAGQSFGLQVVEHAREHDGVYRVRAP
jgi:hypothetical protein